MTKKYRVQTYFFTGNNLTETKIIGDYTESEKNMFVAKLLQLGYKQEEEELIDDCCEGPCGEKCAYYADCEERLARSNIETFFSYLPEPVYDHHGDWICYYDIVALNPIPKTDIQMAINGIVDPAKWDQLEDA